MPMIQSSMRGSAAIHCDRQIAAALPRAHPWHTYAIAISVALLSACTSLPSLAPAGASQQAASLPESQVAARPERMRPMTARDILLEWGVVGQTPSQRKKASAFSAARARVAMALPNYAASIQEIVANAICRFCEQKLYHRMVLHASNLHGVPSGLIHAVIQKESGYDPGARSSRNARGLMQLTPGTARFVGVENSDKLYDPQTNINAGAAYLKYLMRTHGTFDHVLAAYNAGPGNVRKYKGVPPFSETRRYVSDVKKYYAATSQEVL